MSSLTAVGRAEKGGWGNRRASNPQQRESQNDRWEPAVQIESEDTRCVAGHDFIREHLVSNYP